MSNESKHKKESLLSQWKSKKKTLGSQSFIPKTPKDVAIPLSRGQQRLWFLQQLNPNNSFYNHAESYSIKGDLNRSHLFKSLELVIEKHQILKANFPLIDGKAFIQIDGHFNLNIKEIDFSDHRLDGAQQQAKSYISNEITKPFNLSKGPLVRISIIKLSENEHILSLNFHHIIIDEWSMRDLTNLLADYYKKLSNNENIELQQPEIEYKDFAHWDANRELPGQQIDYWKDKLKGELPTLDLQTDYQRPLQPSYKGEHYTSSLSKEDSYSLIALAKKLGTTPFNITLSIFYILLYRYTKQTDILIGLPITNRDHRSLQNLLGFFVDTLVLRTTFNENNSFLELVSNVKKNVLEGFNNKDIPFDYLVKDIQPERSLSMNPFFQVMFVYNNEVEEVDFGSQLTFKKEEDIYLKSSKFDLTLFVNEKDDVLSTTFEYAVDLFNNSTIERFSEHFQILVKGIVNNPELKLSQIPMLAEQEIQLFSKHSETSSQGIYEEYSAIHHIIEDMSFKHPSAIAVSYGFDTLTYKALNEKANDLAQHILSKKEENDNIIGLSIERSTEMIVGILAILKAGCAYLPIDPEYPSQRIEYIIKDAKVNLLVTATYLEDTFKFYGIDLVIADNIETLNHTVKLPKITGSDLAYVIYTSGSTGKPKGVPITHKNIINSTAGRLDFYDHNPTAFLLMSSISFDSSKAGIFWTLCTGGNLVIAEKRIEQDIEKIGSIIKAQGISHTLMLPTLYNLVLQYANIDDLKSLTNVIVAGEACPVSLCKLHFKTLSNVNLYNEYGPTEGTVWCIAHKISTEDLLLDNIPIGRPVANTQVYVLDKSLNHVPLGASGELYISGPGISKGYINRQKRNDEVFINYPKKPNKVLYKTGDLVLYNEDGNIVFIGRSDQQVKIRGYRVELSEIEKVLTQLESIEKAVVIHKNHDNTNKVIAFCQSRNNPNIEYIKSQLAKKLPDYMIPSSLYITENIPSLPNGKIDKNMLMDLEFKVLVEDKSQSSAFEAPRSHLEKQLVTLWEEVLGISNISINQNFFEIGGDSISSIQIIAKARKLGINIAPNQIFQYQTIRELSNFVDTKADETKSESNTFNHLVNVKKTGNLPPLFCIHGGGSHFFFYNPLSNYLNPDRPVYAVQASDIERNIILHDSVEEMAQRFVKEIKIVAPKGPYHVMGYCFSTAVALEICRILKNEKQSVNLIIADTIAIDQNRFAPSKTKRRVKGFFNRLKENPKKAIYKYVETRFYKHLKPKIIKIKGSTAEKNIQKLSDNLADNYSKYQWKPYDNYISLLITERKDPTLYPEIIESWNQISKDKVKVLPIKGRHSKVFKEPFVKNTAEDIERCIYLFENTPDKTK